MVTKLSTRVPVLHDHVIMRISDGRDHSIYVDEARMEPLSLAYSRGLTPADVEWRPVRIGAGDSVTTSRPTWSRSVSRFTRLAAYEIAAEYREAASSE